MDEFKNKVVVITGGGEGIGRALAKKFYDSGANIIINDIDEERLKETRDFLNKDGDRCISYKADVSKNEEVLRFSEFVKKEFGKIDLLINNAGVSLGRHYATEIPNDVSEWIFGVNFWGDVNCVNNFLPLMQPKSGAKIVNICSIFSYFGVYKRSMYCASKSALKAYSESLSYELKEKGISVLSVHPGMVKTKLVKNSKFWKSEKEKLATMNLFDKHASLTAEMTAKRIVKGILRNKKNMHIGRDAIIIYYLIWLFPKMGKDFLNNLIINSEIKMRKTLAKGSDSK